MSSEIPDLSERQKELLDHLPASKKVLTEKLRISKSGVRSHIDAIRDKDIDIRYDRAADQYFIDDERASKIRRISTKHKSSKTKEATSIIEEEERRLLRRLNSKESLTAPAVDDSDKESFCIVLGDLHFGDLVEKEFWSEKDNEYVTRMVYDMETAADAVQEFGKKVLGLKRKLESYTSFDDCYLFLLGDIATGEGVYEGQVHDTEAHLADQTTESVSALYQLCITLSEEFETLQVRGVLGNHGKTRASASHGANTDLITYRWIDDRLRDSGYDNINMATAEAHHHLNTIVCGHKFHVRHGQDGKEHIDETSYSESMWRGWQHEHEFDLAMKGHHHKPSFHKVLNEYPVFACPSPKPGGEFASRIGSPDVSVRKDLGWIFGVSERRPVTWQFLVSEDEKIN